MKKWLFIILSLISINAYAYCPGQYFPDTGICQIQGNNGELIHYNSGSDAGVGAVSSPPKKQRIVVNVPSKYGALAINKKTGISAGYLNATSKSEARKKAIRACENDGKNTPCIIAVEVRNGCIAVAQGKLKGKWKTFYAAEEPGLAEKVALKQCIAAGVSDCEITTEDGCSVP